MSSQVRGVKSTTRASFFGNMTGDQSRAAEPIEALGVGTGLAIQDPTHDFGQFRVTDQQNEDSTEVVAVKRFIA